MNVLISLGAVCVLFVIGLLGAFPALGWLFGILIPYVALAVFLGGMTYRVIGWAKIPVPFRIPTTCGQQKSLPWIKQAKLDCPSSTLGVIGRMFLEIVCFRSLMRNTTTRIINGDRLVYTTNLALWAAAMAFHWSMAVILFRHLRLFLDPVPYCVTKLGLADSFMEVGVPAFYVTSLAFVGALAFLLARRLIDARLRYISLLDDYFPLFLLLGIGLSGLLLRHYLKTNVVGIKELAVGLSTFGFTLPQNPVNALFYGHLFLVCVLLIYIPFGKLLHMGGAFLSPTRNLANNNRMVRHVNPWDYPVKTHTYEEYEDELREKMKGAGLPVDKE
jgi:nitrate reductase gamma subunit